MIRERAPWATSRPRLRSSESNGQFINAQFLEDTIGSFSQTVEQYLFLLALSGGCIVLAGHQLGESVHNFQQSRELGHEAHRLRDSLDRYYMECLG